MREGVGVSNSISSRSPGFSRIPAYNVMPPWLISVPRPSTTVVAKPFDVTTRTGKSTGVRSQRRVFSGFDAIFAHHLRTAASLQITKVTLRLSYEAAITRRRLLDCIRSPSLAPNVLYNLPVNVRVRICLAIWLLLPGIVARAESVSQLKPTGYVNDFAHVLDPQTKAQIEDICTQVDQKAHAQIALVTINTLDGSDIESYAVDLFHKWVSAPSQPIVAF